MTDEAREIIADLQHIVAPDGIQENFQLPAGGIDHWVYTRGQDRSNPVILFIHGGPATPLAPVSWQFQRPIEEYFTVVTYDQRAAGRTLRSVDPATISDTLTIARYVEDAIELAEQIRDRYGVEKLVLIGHSWGTLIGVQAAVRRPDLFHAYVGIGQVIDARANETHCYEYAVAQAELHNHTEALEQLASIAPYPGDQPLTRERIIIARQWAQYRGGLSAFRHETGYFFDAPLLSPEVHGRGHRDPRSRQPLHARPGDRRDARDRSDDDHRLPDSAGDVLRAARLHHADRAG